MKRLLYKIYRAVSGLRYWAQRRLTHTGWLVLVGLALTAGMGLNTERSVTYQLFALLAGLLAAAAASLPFFRARLKLHRVLPRLASMETPFTYHVSITNLGSREQKGLLLMEQLEDARMSFSEFQESTSESRSNRTGRFRLEWPKPRLAKTAEERIPAVPPGGSAKVAMQLTPYRRGLLRFEGLIVARPDPLGILKAFRKVDQPDTLLVLPKRYALPPIQFPGRSQYQPGGIAQASSVGESEEFMALRDYRRGDPLRHIHWRSWARTGRPIVKEFEDEFFVRHALVLDTFVPPGAKPRFEEAVAVAASFACTLPDQESLLDLLFVERDAFCFTAGRGLAHVQQLLEILASVQPCPHGFFDDLREVVIRHSTVVTSCICVFLEWDTPRRILVRDLCRLGVPVSVFLLTSTPALTAQAVHLEPGMDLASLHTLRMEHIQEDLMKSADEAPRNATWS